MWFKTIKMKWDLCSSPPCVPFYPYTMFQNPMPKPSCHISRKTIITQKVLDTQSFNIVHCDWYIQKTYMCRFSSLFEHFFPVQIDFFLNFLSEEFSKQPKISHFVDFDWENVLKWLELCVFRVQGVPNPMAQVLSLYDKCFLKNQNFRQKFHILLILTGKNALKWLEWYIFMV